jgi:hypothetical protein
MSNKRSAHLPLLGEWLFKSVLVFPYQGKCFTQMFWSSPNRGMAFHGCFELPLIGELLYINVLNFP